MLASLETLTTIQKLADTGHHAAVARQLGALSAEELEQSPTLALLFGIAQARLGQHTAGKRWVGIGLEAARARRDHAVEARALNVSGAIALAEGRIDDAIGYLTRGLAEAETLGDRATVGRCSNNLGTIASLRGQYGRAIGSYTMALAAFQQVKHRGGVAEALHNLAITYREQGDLGQALEHEARAAHESGAAGDVALEAKVRSGRAQIRLFAGDAVVAQREVQNAIALQRKIGDVVGEAESLRVLANALAGVGKVHEAEAMLYEVIGRATTVNRPLLVAQAERDLAALLHEQGRAEHAATLAGRARTRFEYLGAMVEVHRLDELLSHLTAAV
jgi:tetratricopeptide (TPR) repeat protein